MSIGIFSYGSYRDMQYLYLLLEYLPGGDLFSYYRQVGRFKESAVRFYASEIILALEYLHNLSIVYRYDSIISPIFFIFLFEIQRSEIRKSRTG